MNSKLIPTIAIIGRQNVGKSTLFNKLTHTRDALVADIPGLTRDYKYGYIKYNNHEFIIIDTGGIAVPMEGISAYITNQSLQIIQKVNIVLLIVDNHTGIIDNDKNIANYLIKYRKNVIVVVNKSDGKFINYTINNFYSLGLGEIIQISALYGRGINALLKKIILLTITINNNKYLIYSLKERELAFPLENNNKLLSQDIIFLKSESVPIKIAIIGRPNVGKSTLINYLLDEKRMLVLNTPGTTRDSICSVMKYGNQTYLLIDTAGIRKQNKVIEKIEKISIMKTIEAIKHASIILLIIDINESIFEHNLSLLNFVLKSGKPIVIAINKCDLLSKENLERTKIQLNKRLAFIKFIRIHFISALYGTNIHSLFSSINEGHENSIAEIKTTTITKIMRVAADEHKPPLLHGRRIKLKYAHIGNYKPLTIIIHGINVESLSNTYKRYLINYFCRALDIFGITIYIRFNNNTNPFIKHSNI